MQLKMGDIICAIIFCEIETHTGNNYRSLGCKIYDAVLTIIFEHLLGK